MDKYPENPLKVVTSRFKPKKVLYRKADFVLVEGIVHGDTKSHVGVACRYHKADKIGYPQMAGNPQWMVLPADSPSDIRDLVEAFSGKPF